jgi:GTP cyclohydrolase IA
MNNSEDDSNQNGNGHNGNGDTKNADDNNMVAVTMMDQKLRSTQLLKAFELDYPSVDKDAIKASVVNILAAVGEDPQREGLQGTPRRVANAYDELLSGYRTDPSQVINNAIFDVEYDDMVIVNNIEYYSLCEHHMLPFLGHAHVAYIPDEKVIGLSKIPRIVDMFARRLQVQERLTRQIAEFLNEVLEPKGVAVVMDGQHMCSMIRGVQKHDSGMTTSAMLGAFREDRDTRTEFMSHIERADKAGSMIR